VSALRASHEPGPSVTGVTQKGVDAFRADRDEVLAVARSLTPEEWETPSDCDGWRVQDVVAHMANVCRTLVDPGSLPPGVPGDLEATQAAQAEAHRQWSSAQVLADYEEVSAEATEALAGLQAPGVGDAVIPIENAGTYPLHMVANALAFDHFCHLRNDILRPNGPIERRSPPADEVRVRACLEWLLAGLPQMSPQTRAVLTDPVTFELTGPGGGCWAAKASRDGLVVEEGSEGKVRIISPATEFIIWSTGRRPWQDRHVELRGDESYITTVLDSIRLF
jgi:uncharacterized protein (TIGR03083 family)